MSPANLCLSLGLVLGCLLYLDYPHRKTMPSGLPAHNMTYPVFLPAPGLTSCHPRVSYLSIYSFPHHAPAQPVSCGEAASFHTWPAAGQRSFWAEVMLARAVSSVPGYRGEEDSGDCLAWEPLTIISVYVTAKVTWYRGLSCTMKCIKALLWWIELNWMEPACT